MSREVYSFSYSVDTESLYSSVIFVELENHYILQQSVRSTCGGKLHYDLHHHITRRDTYVSVTYLLLRGYILIINCMFLEAKGLGQYLGIYL
jgi:hypothetical protein